MTSIQNIFHDTFALVLPPPILLASFCVLDGLKEVNTGVRVRWYWLNPGFTTTPRVVAKQAKTTKVKNKFVNGKKSSKEYSVVFLVEGGKFNLGKNN